MTGTPRGYPSPSGLTASEAARLRGERERGAGRGSSNGGTSGYQSATPVPPPVAWTPDREQRGRRPPDDLYRCPRRGCPVVSASLPVMVAHVRAHEAADAVTAADRRVPDLHQGSPAEPCEHDEPCACGCGEPIAGPPAKRFASEACRARYYQRAARAATLAVVPAFPAPAAALTVRAGLATAAASVPSPAAANQASPQWRAAVAVLGAGPERSNREIARLAGTGHMTVIRARHAMEAAGVITVFRALPAPPEGERPCPCGCGVMVAPGTGGQAGRRFASEACRKRLARRDERRELAAVRAAAAAAVARELAVVPGGATVTSGRCITTVS